MGLETITYRAPQLWNLVPTEIKDAPSHSIFQEKIKSWYCDDYPCMQVMKNLHCQRRFCVTHILQNLAHDINLLMVSCHFSMSYFIDARCKLVL